MLHIKNIKIVYNLNMLYNLKFIIIERGDKLVKENIGHRRRYRYPKYNKNIFRKCRLYYDNSK